MFLLTFPMFSWNVVTNVLCQKGIQFMHTQTSSYQWTKSLRNINTLTLVPVLESVTLMKISAHNYENTNKYQEMLIF